LRSAPYYSYISQTAVSKADAKAADIKQELVFPLHFRPQSLLALLLLVSLFDLPMTLVIPLFINDFARTGGNAQQQA